MSREKEREMYQIYSCFYICFSALANLLGGGSFVGVIAYPCYGCLCYTGGIIWCAGLYHE